MMTMMALAATIAVAGHPIDLARILTRMECKTTPCQGCPDIWELEDGDFAIIGSEMTLNADQLPPTASCGPDERVVRIPRKTLVLAKQDIPDRL